MGLQSAVVEGRLRDDQDQPVAGMDTIATTNIDGPTKRSSNPLHVVMENATNSASNATTHDGFTKLEDTLDDEEMEMLNFNPTGKHITHNRRRKGEIDPQAIGVPAGDTPLGFRGGGSGDSGGGTTIASGASTLDATDSVPRISDQDPAQTAAEIRNVAHVAFTEALLADKPKKWTKAMFKLYFFLLVAVLNSVICGYTSSLVGTLNSMKEFQRFFGISTDGSATGIFMGIQMIGNIIGSFFCGPLTDWWGRRMGMFTAGLTIITGTCLQGFAFNKAVFMGGRFILGFGIAICTTAGPVYVAEMAHPAWRGPLTGLYNVIWIVGAIPAVWSNVWVENIQSDAQWRIPVWMQVVPAGLLCIGCFFIPETPRWLYSNEKPELAVRVLEKYHGEGNRKSPIVLLTYRELVEEVFINGSDKRWWDYSDLIGLGSNPRAQWWRNACVFGMAFCSQWSGNVAITYFMPNLLDQIVAENQKWRFIYNGVFNVLSAVFAATGACLVDRIGRKRVLLSATIMFSFCWIFITALTDVYANKQNSNRHGAWAAIAFINIFQLIYSFAYTPLSLLYPVECLAYESRAKGMGIYNLAVNIAVFFNIYAVPVIMHRLRWKFYIIYATWDVCEALFIFFFFVETRGRTLEEINEIFKASYPPRKSLEKHSILVQQKKGDILYKGLAPPDNNNIKTDMERQ